jgi:hypothetical protein
MDYIIMVKENKLNDIKQNLNIKWQSQKQKNLLHIESDLSMEDVLEIDGIISCQVGRAGKFLSQ